MTESELAQTVYETQVAKCIIANQYALELNKRLETTPQYKHKLKQFGTPFIKELIKLHKAEFLKVENAAITLERFNPDVIDEAMVRMEKMLGLLSKMIFVDWDILENVLIGTAYDQKSMGGLAKKIIKSKK